MAECHCERCQPDSPKKTYSESWRVECLARELMRWTLDERRTYLEKMDPRTRQELEAELMRRWLAKKAGL